MTALPPFLFLAERRRRLAFRKGAGSKIPKDDTFEKVENEIEPKFLERPMMELEKYHRLAVTLKWDDELKIVLYIGDHSFTVANKNNCKKGQSTISV